MFARAEMSLSQRGKSALEHAREVVVNAGKNIRTRVVLFKADIQTLVSHQQHPEQQKALEIPGNATTDTSPAVQPKGRAPISPSLEKYLDEVL